jgi:hypothetical protein
MPHLTWRVDEPPTQPPAECHKPVQWHESWKL